jgi:hypothetical protein
MMAPFQNQNFNAAIMDIQFSCVQKRFNWLLTGIE